MPDDHVKKVRKSEGKEKEEKRKRKWHVSFLAFLR